METKMMIQALVEEILMGNTPLVVAATAFFTVIGLLLSILTQNAIRDVDKEDSPKNFSKSYFIKNNLTRLLLAILLSFVLLTITGENLGTKTSLLIGLPCGLFTDIVAYFTLKYFKKFLNNLLTIKEDEFNN